MTLIRQVKYMVTTKFVLSKEISIQHYQYTCSFLIIQPIEISFPHIRPKVSFCLSGGLFVTIS
jgi:hypothetical protein